MKSTSSVVNTLIIFVIVIATLYFAREVLIPIALAGILSFMLAPPVRKLQNLRFPRGLAVIAVVLLAFAAIFALGGIMARQVTYLAEDLPRYQATISAKIAGLRGGGGTVTLKRAEQVLEQLGKEIGNQTDKPAQPSQLSQSAAKDQGPIPVEVHEPSGGPLETLRSLISPLLSPIATTGLIIVFVVFILIQREDLRDRLIRLAGSTDIPHTTAAIDDAAHRLSRLFLTQLTINTGFAILVGLGLWWIGIPSAFLWGILAGVLRFIPYVGSILGMVFPLVLAVSVDPGWSMVLWTAALFLGLEALTGQVIEPVFMGHSSGLSPVAVILAATFWAWLWGPVGLVLATPLTVILVVLGRHVDALKFLDIMFGNEPVLSDAESFYQRMLARDPVEAVEHAKSFMAKHSLADYCDEVARPALMLAQKDAERGVLEEGNTKILRETVDSLFVDIAHEHWVARREAHAATLAQTAKLPVLDKDQLALGWRSEAPLLLIGVRTELDEAAAVVLSTLAQTHGIATRMERPEVLKAANLAKLDVSGVAMICLSSVDMKTPAHIHFAARRLKSLAPSAKLLLGVWSAADDKVLTDLKEAVNADYAARSFHRAATIVLEEAAAGAVTTPDRSRSLVGTNQQIVGKPFQVGGA
jgi:predicted PurR-regulated permease PerM